MVLEELNKVPAIAASIFLKMKEITDPKESNCKMLAQRIMHFKFADLVPKIQQAISELHTFLHTSYKGVYCSLCDAQTHSLIDVDKKEITLSEGFCRNIVSHSLHPLTYLHVHIKKIMDLVLSFLTYCDDKGIFNPEEAVPPSIVLEVQEGDKKLLTDCTKFRNDEGWLEYCSGICEKFQFAQFNEFFQPDIKKYHKAVLYMQEKLLKFPPPETDIEEMEKEAEEEADEPEDEKEKEEEAKTEEPKTEEPKAEEPKAEEPKTEEAKTEEAKTRKLKLKKRLRYARYLKEEEAEAEKKEETEEEGGEEGGEGEEGEEEEEPTIMDLEKKYEKMDLFHKAMNAVIPLDKATCIFSEPGVDLFEIGLHSHITEENALLAKGMGLVENQKVEEVVEVVKESVQAIHFLITSILSILVFFKLN